MIQKNNLKAYQNKMFIACTVGHTQYILPAVELVEAMDGNNGGGQSRPTAAGGESGSSGGGQRRPTEQ